MICLRSLICLSIVIAFAVCSREKFQTYIVGGAPTSRNELPYQISILLHDKHDCGGSILNENFIITAAHCVEEDPTVYKIVAGEHDITIEEGTEQTRSISEIILHPNYDVSTRQNDIAIVRLNAPLIFNDAVKSIILPEPGHTAVGDALISGWGFLDEDGESPNVLHKATVPIVTDNECRYAYGSSTIADSMICAGFEQGEVDACRGDSGGPMIANDAGTYLAGVISWGSGCGHPGFPGVYTEVSHFIPWIKSNLK